MGTQFAKSSGRAGRGGRGRRLRSIAGRTEIAVGPIRQWPLLALGRWDEVLEAGDEMVRLAEPLGDRWTVRYARPRWPSSWRAGAREGGAGAGSDGVGWCLRKKGLFALPSVVAYRTLGAGAEAERSLADAVATWVDGDDGYHGCDVARETLTSTARPARASPRSPMRTMKSAAPLQTDVARDRGRSWRPPDRGPRSLSRCGRRLALVR
jgi:hypothetical protein